MDIRGKCWGKWLFFLVMVLVVIGQQSCGSGGGSSNQTPSDSINKIEGIGPAGGTVTSKDGKASVTIPAGALAEAKNITAEVASGTPAGTVGSVYEFGPDGTIFNNPVTISIKYDESDIPAGVNESNLRLGRWENTQWVEVADPVIDVIANSVSGKSTGFSVYGVIVTSESFAPDTTLPQVSYVSPADGFVAVPVNVVITAAFSEVIDSATINAESFTLVNTATSERVAGTVIYDSVNRIATFSPSASLSYNTFYTVTITTGVKDAAGNALAGKYAWTFKAKENAVPKANAGVDQSVVIGSAVSLDGGGSSDEDGDVISYMWSITSRPDGSTVNLSDSTAGNLSFTPDLPGTYELSLVVNDEKDDSPLDIMTITVKAKVAVVGERTGKIAEFLAEKGIPVEDIAGYPASYDPKISEDYVVWRDFRNDQEEGDIYAYRISTGEEFAVTTTGNVDQHQIDGDYIVWQDGRNVNPDDNVYFNSDIYAYRISTGEEFAITTVAGAQGGPQIDGDYIVWTDMRNDIPDYVTYNSDIYAYRISTGEEFAVTTAAGRQEDPHIDGDYIVWSNGDYPNSNIYAYRISTGEEFAVTTSVGRQADPHINGDYIIWQDVQNYLYEKIYAYRITTGEVFTVSTTEKSKQPQIDGDYIVWSNGDYPNSNIYAYRISTGEEFAVTTAAGSQSDPRIDGDYIVWRDSRNGEYVIYAYRISTGEEFAVTKNDWNNYQPEIDNGRIVWSEFAGSGPYINIFLSTDLGSTEQKISKGKPIDTLKDNLRNYNMILFGDHLISELTLPIFDAADVAGLNMLGIGTNENDYPLGCLLATNGQLGLTQSNDTGSLMEVNVTDPGANHPIFNGLDTSSVLHFEDSNAYCKDEQAYSIDSSDTAAPPEWSILAEMGANMYLAGQPAILEFTTSNGTKVILDGSAVTCDGFKYWTQERWDLLYNEVVYLME